MSAVSIPPQVPAVNPSWRDIRAAIVERLEAELDIVARRIQWQSAARRAETLERLWEKDQATLTVLLSCDDPEFWTRCGEYHLSQAGRLLIAIPCACCWSPVGTGQARLSITAYGRPLCDTHLPSAPSCDPDPDDR